MHRNRIWTLGVVALVAGFARLGFEPARTTPRDAAETGAAGNHAQPDRYPCDRSDCRVTPLSSDGRVPTIRLAITRDTSSDARLGALLLLEPDATDPAGLGAVRVVDLPPGHMPRSPGSCQPITDLPHPSTAGLTTAAALVFVALRRRV